MTMYNKIIFEDSLASNIIQYVKCGLLAGRCKKESISIHSKLLFRDSLARNMFNGSIMDYCLTHVTSEAGNEYVKKVHDQGLPDHKYVQ